MARKQKTKTIAGPLILNERTELVPIDSIQPWEGNPNQGDLGAIITLMQRHGFWGTLLVQKSSSRIVAGNFRWRAAQHLGYKQVPVTFIDVPDRQAREILAADNRSNRLGTDDPALMAEWLQSIVSDVGDLGGTGYAQEALDQLIADLASGSLTGAGAFDESDRLKEQFQILITCESEFQQVTLLERLNAEGLKCRALLS